MFNLQLLIKVTLFLGSLTISMLSHAAIENFCWPNFYFGADAQIRNMRFAYDFGGNIYSRLYPGGNFYIGIKGNDFIGIESGYELSRSRTRPSFLPAGSNLLGVPVNFPVKQNIVARTRGLHTSVIGFFPLKYNKKFNILLSVGLVNLTVKLENATTEIANLPISFGVNLSQNKTILRVMTGFQYMLSEYFSIRPTVRWENTAQLRNIQPILLDSPNRAKAKNSFIFALGFALNFN